MQSEPFPLLRDLVLVGGGHAHGLVLRKWIMRPVAGVRLTVINPEPVAAYTGMVPGWIAGHYRRDEVVIDLQRLARQAGARLILDPATGLDRATRRVILKSGRSLPYDILSLDVGASAEISTLPGFADHGVPVRPLSQMGLRWDALVAGPLASPRVVILGAGLGGCEVALAMQARIAALGRKATITLVDPNPATLSELSRTARKRLIGALTDAGITVRAGAQAVQVAQGAVVLAGGETLGSDLTLAAAGARAHPWLRETGLQVNEGGFVVVGPTLATSDPEIFAVGDCAHLGHAPRPKSGVFAVRAAGTLDRNLRAAVAGRPATATFRPQRRFLKLLALGGKSALGTWGWLTVSGPWVWRWKDRIDRRFMDMLGTWPAMVRPAVPADAALGLRDAMAAAPLCAGCGAKVPPGTLRAALSGLPRPERTQVLSSGGDDAAIVRRPEGGVRVMTTDHLRALTDDPRRMARIAANHALGDVWAMGARPEFAMAQITLPRLGPALAEDTLAEVMAGIGDILGPAGIDLVGGHTSVGAELTIGLTLTGLAMAAIRKGGSQDGDALILTKPLGTGVILAAEMSGARFPGLVLGEVWNDALTGMEQSLGPAARLLSPMARAMTDVTGFGLAGHLLEMLEAGPVLTARLRADAIALLPGAIDLSAAGVASALMPANRGYLGAAFTGKGPLADLLFDPQTCGGLLAAVPGEMAEALCRSIGGQAAIIGHLEPGPLRIILD